MSRWGPAAFTYSDRRVRTNCASGVKGGSVEILSLTEALTRAVERYRREVFLEDLSGEFAALRADQKAWKH